MLDKEKMAEHRRSDEKMMEGGKKCVLMLLGKLRMSQNCSSMMCWGWLIIQRERDRETREGKGGTSTVSYQREGTDQNADSRTGRHRIDRQRRRKEWMWMWMWDEMGSFISLIDESCRPSPVALSPIISRGTKQKLTGQAQPLGD